MFLDLSKYFLGVFCLFALSASVVFQRKKHDLLMKCGCYEETFRKRPYPKLCCSYAFSENAAVTSKSAYETFMMHIYMDRLQKNS